MCKINKKECELILKLLNKSECIEQYETNWDLRNELFWIIHDHYTHDKSNRGLDWKAISDIHFKVGCDDKICDVLRDYVNKHIQNNITVLQVKKEN